jgi:RNA polymerase sigma-70 factor (ECF subfamily)
VVVDVVRGKRVAGDAPADAAPATAGSLDDLDTLIRDHSAYVAHLAYRVLHRHDEVDDIVQDVFIKLFRHLGQIRQREALRGWLATTTIRLVRRRLRVRRIGFLLRRKDRVDPLALPAAGASQEDHAALAQVHRALEGVGVNARIAWVLRYLEQERLEDVARICNCATSTAKRRIAVANVAVRRALGDE